MRVQLKDIDPSAKEPLFRRIMSDKRLAYLREGKGIIGFELDLDVKQRLSGFLLVGIQKHTIYVYRSDLDEEPRLVLFPSLDKLFDEDFEMLPLHVIKTVFYDASFQGKVLGTGQLETLVSDLTPPEKEVDIPEGVSEQMLAHMRKIKEQGVILAQENDVVVPMTETTAEPVVEAPVDDGYTEDYNNYDEYDSFDEGGDVGYSYDEFEDDTMADEPVYEEPMSEPADDERTIKLREQTFASLVEVGDFATLRLGVPKAISTQVVNKALQSNVDAEYRIELAILLFSKLFNDKKI